MTKNSLTAVLLILAAATASAETKLQIDGPAPTVGPAALATLRAPRANGPTSPQEDVTTLAQPRRPRAGGTTVLPPDGAALHLRRARANATVAVD
jgi:hypothetical protein